MLSSPSGNSSSSTSPVRHFPSAEPLHDTLPRLKHETDHALRLTDEGREIGRRKAEAQQAEPAQIRPDLRDPPRDMVACDASEGASVKSRRSITSMCMGRL